MSADVLDAPVFTGTITTFKSAEEALAAWSTDQPETVAAAKAKFDELRRHGPVSKVLPEGGTEPVQVREFDPAASYVAVGPMAGG